MDIVLGVSMAPRTVRLVAIEGQNADGVTVEQEEFEVGAAGNSADSPADALDQVIDAIIGSREGVLEGGHRLTATGVTWSDPAGVGALREAIAGHELDGVMLVAPLLAAAVLAQTVGYALGYERLAMLFVEPANATLAVVDVADGSIVDLHRRQIGDGSAGGLAAELAAMVSGLDARGSRADGVFLIGCGTDIVALKSTVEAATPLPVTGPEEPDMALARGAALASANAPLFASSTAALAYALDPGTGELSLPAISPTYLDDWDDADVGTDARAYSAVPDYDERPPGRPRSMLLAGSALVGIVAAIGGVVLVTLTSDRPGSDGRHNPGVSVATPAVQLPAAPPSNPPQAQLPAPSAAPPPPAPPPSPSGVAAPAPAPSTVQQPAPQTAVTPPPAAPVRRAPARSVPQYVPPPVQEAAPQHVPPPVQEAAPPPAAVPAPAPAAPPPPPPAAPPPAAPQLPQQPPVTMYLHFPFVTVPIPITPPPPPGQ
ncbi:hypothetical protein [Mycobacterium sp. E2479]|uniref:DUF7159 family protein n=1 Tax=Mycobacterium sp. E2479 TaxID=1834134 RepID=UPI0007FEE51B|nr:hypothetical protein [Mycobacterium sp. E2479]OBH51744.1 hypothetical protein A5686_11605 [Mycobacterium sp. E2479]